jgi:hypothetical protein
MVYDKYMYNLFNEDNMSTITVTISRPDDSIPFWYETEYYQTIRPELLDDFYFPSLADGTIIYSDNQTDSPNIELVHTRVTVFRDEEAKNNYLTLFYERFPDYESNRSNYCAEHNHTLTIEYSDL